MTVVLIIIQFVALYVFLMALIHDTYFALILYACGSTPSCTCYLYSFSVYREESIYLYADKTETGNDVFMHIRTAVDYLRIFSC